MVDAPAPSRPPVLTRPNSTFFEDELPTPWTESNVCRHGWLQAQMSVNGVRVMHPIITKGTWKEFGGAHEDKSQNDLRVSQLARAKNELGPKILAWPSADRAFGLREPFFLPNQSFWSG